MGSEDTPERLILQTECPGIGQGLEEQITSFLYNHSDTGLVVIDTLQKVRSCDQSGSMYASDYKNVSALKSLADKFGIEESDQTHFDRYAEAWLNRQKPYFKATTLAGYRRNLEIVYPLIGGIPLAKIRPLTLEEMCEELRKRPGRNGNQIKECTVQKYLETVSSVLEDAKKNDIIPFNPALEGHYRAF